MASYLLCFELSIFKISLLYYHNILVIILVFKVYTVYFYVILQHIIYSLFYSNILLFLLSCLLCYYYTFYFHVCYKPSISCHHICFYLLHEFLRKNNFILIHVFAFLIVFTFFCKFKFPTSLICFCLKFLFSHFLLYDLLAMDILRCHMSKKVFILLLCLKTPLCLYVRLGSRSL